MKLKSNVKTLLLIGFLGFNTFLGKSQSTYFTTFKDSLNDFCSYIIEDSSSSILGAGFSSTILSDKSTWISSIWRITSNDTLCKHYFFNDTSSQFNYIEQRGNTYHIIATLLLPPEYDVSLIQDIQLDSNLNIISRSNITRLTSLFLIDNKIRKLGNRIYILGWERNDSCSYDVVLKTSLDFDSLDYIRLWPRTINLMDCMLSQDSSKFLLFTMNYNNIPGCELIEFDTSFSNYTVKNLPYRYWPGTFDFDILYESDITAEWITDSTFLIGCTHIQSQNNQADPELSLGFSILDSSLTTAPVYYIGTPDTIDYAGVITSFDIDNSNKILFCGTKNRVADFFPGVPSWIIAGKFNQNFNTDYLRFYGGDAFYLTHSILSTSDGGSVIMGRKFDYLTQENEWDVFFLKLNSEGLIVNNHYTEIEKTTAILIYPNPSADIIKIETTISEGFVRIFTSEGVLIETNKFNSPQFNLNISNLSSGLYICVLRDYSGNYITSKFIKN